MTAAVIELGLLAREALQDGHSGRIVAVFENSFYAVLGERWICVGSKHLGSGPLHVLCEGRPPDWPAVGDMVSVNHLVLHIARKPFAAFGAAALWAPAPPPHWTPASLQAGLRLIDDIWQPGEDGLAAAGARLPPPAKKSVLIEMAAPALDALDLIIMAALGGRDSSAADEAGLITLIGLGPGLTPSGDDLLGGALMALAALDRLNARDRLWALCRDHLDRTNDISAAHLRVAARGYGAAAMHAAIDATLAGDAPRLAPALSAVAAIGHSSGRDGFAGVLIVLRAAVRQLAGNGACLSGPDC